MPDRFEYTVRPVAIAEDEIHACTGRIVAVVQSSWNPDRAKWYLTALVERPARPTVTDA